MAAIEALGGKLILMASRALARVARGPADYERVYDRMLTQATQPVILHWLGDMFDPALAGYWGSARRRRRDGDALGVIAANAGQGRRHQDLAARQGQGDRDAPPAARRRAHVHRRRLQLRRADRRRRRRQRDEPAAQRRAARHLRRDRAGGERRARRARRGRRGALPRDPRADGAAVAPHLPGADALLQDRRRLPRLAERPPAPLHDGRRPAERALAAAPRRAVPPRRPRRPARAARARGRAHAARCWRCTASTAEADAMRDFSQRPPLALDQHRDGARRAATLDAIIEACARARHPRDLAVARPGRTRSACERTAALVREHTASSSRAIAAAACSRRSMRPAARRALDDNRRAVDEARHARRAPAWCSWSAACPARSPARPQSKDIVRARAARCATASRRRSNTRASAGMPLAIEPLHPMYAADRACVNTLEQALDLCDALDPRPTPRRIGALLGVAVDVYHVWWDPEARKRRSRARAASACSPSTSATGWCRRATCSTTAA